jgi:HD-GYP domain-containing protein (c-di-GMP phosphodiesterase class II)
MSRAVAILRDGRGRQWDPQIVDAFVRSIAAKLESDTGAHLRIVRSDDETDSVAITA